MQTMRCSGPGNFRMVFIGVLIPLSFFLGMFVAYTCTPPAGKTKRQSALVRSRTGVSNVAPWMPKSIRAAGDNLEDVIDTTGTGNDGWVAVRKRVTVLRQRCRDLQLPEPSTEAYNRLLSRLLVVDEYQWMFCDVPKCASTNLKRIAYVLSGRSESSDPGDLKGARARTSVIRLEDYSMEGIRKRLQSYKKVLMIREPLERVLSAYRDNKTIQHVSVKPPFLEYLEKVFEKNQSKNHHLNTVTNLCHPCFIDYDFIGSIDTYDRDIGLLLEWLDATDVVDVPQRNTTGYTAEKSGQVLKEFFKDIPSSMIQRLWNIFQKDYFLFDYPFPYHLIH